MQIKELYKYNPVVLECIDNQDFLELELDDEYKIPLEKLAEYYSVDYINNLLNYIDYEIIRQYINFDLNKQYKELYIRYDKDNETGILYKLNDNEQFLKPFAENVKTYRLRK